MKSSLGYSLILFGDVDKLMKPSTSSSSPNFIQIHKSVAAYCVGHVPARPPSEIVYFRCERATLSLSFHKIQ